VLDLVRGRMALCVEIKAGEAVVEAVAALVDDRAMRGDIVIFSFDPMTIAAARRRLPDCPAVLLLSEWGQPARYAPGDVRDAGACGATAIGFDGRVPHEGLVAAAHAAGLPVFAWTINDVATARALAAEGVDVLISDVPDLIEAGLG
jgi:glycerophosphoryl diester phosphodiesterase